MRNKPCQGAIVPAACLAIIASRPRMVAAMRSPSFGLCAGAYSITGVVPNLRVASITGGMGRLAQAKTIRLRGWA